MKGRAAGYSNVLCTYMYAYECDVCNKTFKDSAPETDRPLYRRCYAGKATGAAHVKPSGRRRSKHKSEWEGTKPYGSSEA